MQRFRCDCGAVAETRIIYCPSCLRTGLYQPVVERPFMPRLRGAVTMTALQLQARGAKTVRLKGAWSDLFPGGVLTPFMSVLYGIPGAGKSTLALMLAEAWPGRSLFIPSEQGLGAALGALVRRLEVTRPNFALFETCEQMAAGIGGYDLVVVDSLQRCGIDPAELRSLIVDGGASLLVTSEVNASGDVRGGLAASHVADAVVELPEYGVARVRKSRFGPCSDIRWEDVKCGVPA